MPRLDKQRGVRKDANVPTVTGKGYGRPSRDHALVLHRFIGGLQVFGGFTLVVAYSVGATSLAVAWAPAALVGIGLLQIAVGLWWLVRARDLRWLLLRHPGTYVAGTLGGATLVCILGGGNLDEIFITSAMIWLIAAGAALPGQRWLLGSLLATAIVVPIWVAVEGDTGGYEENGEYFTAALGLASSLIAGAWLGRTTGVAARTLNRWHSVEVHERGLILELRRALDAVDARATALAARLPVGAASAELDDLRARLSQGIVVREGQETIAVGDLIHELVVEHGASDASPEIVLTLEADVRDVALRVPTADAVAAVLRRQLGNIARHAPAATRITIEGTTLAGTLVLRLEDDGHGALPFRAGVGTAWSDRQLRRVSGHAAYYAAANGVGFEINVPIEVVATISGVPQLSVKHALDRFAVSMLEAIRWAGYVGDSLGAYVERDDLGPLWLLMPLGAVLIELVLSRRSPLRRFVGEDARLVIASVLAVALAACFTYPEGSLDALVPATTTPVVLAHLIEARRGGLWLVLELLRLVAVAPLIVRHGAEAVELVVVYPWGLALIVWGMMRLIDRAKGLERSVADALGRSTLASATVRGLALRHDAIDVMARNTVDAPGIARALADLESALDALRELGSGSLDPRDTVLLGLESALGQPVVEGHVDRAPAVSSTPSVAGAIDRITLVELAALAADERASCAPPGLLGRRRLRTVTADWTTSADGRRTSLRVAVEPNFTPPDERALRRLEAVAATIGVEVESSREALEVTYVRG